MVRLPLRRCPARGRSLTMSRFHGCTTSYGELFSDVSANLIWSTFSRNVARAAYAVSEQGSSNVEIFTIAEDFSIVFLSVGF